MACSLNVDWIPLVAGVGKFYILVDILSSILSVTERGC